MASDLLTKWIAFFRPLALGQFGKTRANGLALSCGQFWVRTAGGYNLYRWTGQRHPVAPGRIVGAGAADSTVVGNFPHVAHEPSTCYWYLLRAVGAGGVEEENCRQVVRVQFDDAGDVVGPQPNAPESLSARASLGGRVDLSWQYNRRGQEVAPATFDVFGDGGTGTMDWQAPVGSVESRRGKVDYSWTSESFGDGTRVQFAVRARSQVGTSESNERTVMVWTRSVGPELVDMLMAELGEERRQVG